MIVTPDPADPSRGSARVNWAIAVGIAVVWFTVLLGTSRDYALVWDEGNSILRARTLSRWFEILTADTGSTSQPDPFARETLSRYWPFAREEPDGHTPFFAELSLAGWRITRSWLSPLSSYRIGAILLASITSGLVYRHVESRRGRVAGIVAAMALFVIPQCFSLAHYAHYDMPMACCWILAQAAFVRSLRKPWWSVGFGIALGLSVGSKFTGIFAFAAPLMWVILYEWIPSIHLVATPPEERRSSLPGTRSLMIAAPIAALTLYAILPPWWGDPIEGVRRFLASNLTRQDTVRIPSIYLGQIYEFALPWHNSIVLTAMTVPLAILALGAIGMIDIVARRSRSRDDVVWILSWAVLMVVRSLPNAPGHDGVRQLLTSTMSLAVLAGYGAGAICRWVGDRRSRWIGPVLVVAAMAEGLVAIAQLYPYTMSYYNVATGGLPGADRRGMPITFYWDTLGPDFLGWVRRESSARDLELRFPIYLASVQLLREWGDLPAKVPIVPLDDTAEKPDYVVQRRRSVFYPFDLWLERHGKPRFVVRRQGVDLLRVYPFEQSLQAFMETRDEPIPAHLRNY